MHTPRQRRCDAILRKYSAVVFEACLDQRGGVRVLAFGVRLGAFRTAVEIAVLDCATADSAGGLVH